MRRWVPLWLSLVVLFTLVAPAAAATEIQVIVGGARVSFDVPPVNKDGRVLVPLRAIGEALGFTVGYEGATQTVSLVKPGTEIILVLGSQEARVNGQVKTLDVPAQVVDGRTLVPVRFVAENLGAAVSWDPATQTVTVTPKAADVATAPPDPDPEPTPTPAPEPTPTPVPTEPTGSPEALALLAQVTEASAANTNMRTQGTIDTAMKMSGSGMEMAFQIGMELEIHQQGQDVLMTMDLSMPVELGLPATTIAVAVRDGLMYMQEDGDDWVFVQAIMGEEDASLSELGLQDPTAFLELVTQVLNRATVEIVGTEVLDGVNTTVLEMKVPGAALTDLTAELIGALALEDAVGADASLDIAFEDLYLKMWVDPATGFTHRLVEELHMAMSGSDSSAAFDMGIDMLADIRMTPTTDPIAWPELPPQP